MREILFRGKSVNDGEWVYGSLVITTLEPVDDAPIKHYHIEDMTIGCFPNEFQSGISETVDPNTVGQFTGLYDSTKWENLTDAEKISFYKQHYIGEDGMSVRFQHIDDVKHLWKGTKIFEGDIVKDTSGVVYPVVFDLTGFYLKYAPPHSHGFHYDLLPLSNYWHAHGAIVEVIGNIHDNPELLEVE